MGGQIFVKWIGFKFFQKENKWSGGERRQTVEIDEMLIKQFLETYKKHVEYVGVLSTTLQTSTDTMKSLAREFEDHRGLVEDTSKMIRDIHRRTPAIG